MMSLSELHAANAAWPRQCPALSLMHLMSNCCIREEGHKGSHENNLGTCFTKCVMKAIDLPDGWGVKCQDHPRYKLKRKPTGNCEMCWRLWIKWNS